MSSTIEVLVLFKNLKRKLTLPAGSKIDTLKTEFMKDFSDVLPDDALVTQYIFKVFDPRFNEFIDVKEDYQLSDLDRVLVQDESDAGDNDPNVPHPLENNVTYRIWSSVSREHFSLMKRNNTTIKCNGSMKSSDNDLVSITTKEKDNPNFRKLFRLQLKDPENPNKCYLITGKGNNMDVYVQHVDISSVDTPPQDTESTFEPSYYFPYTQFRCKSVNDEVDLYLSSDENGKTTLTKGGSKEYPNPSTLFICNKVV